MSTEQSIPLDQTSEFINWTSIILGAIVATAFSAILIAFGAAVGMGVASTAPSWRDASAALWILSGLYLIIVAFVSFGIGGYVAGRIRYGTMTSSPLEVEHRDGTHGLAAWALAVVMGATLAGVIGASSVSRSTSAAPAITSSAEPLLSYDIDRMLRPVRRVANADLAVERAEAGRILLTSSGHADMLVDDRAYLIQLVTTISGVNSGDAEKRVDAAITNSRTAIARTRRSAVIAAFSIATSLLLGAVVSWAAACAGGRHRDGSPLPDWMRSTDVGQTRPI